jgi:hypothetical protein
MVMVVMMTRVMMMMRMKEGCLFHICLICCYSYSTESGRRLVAEGFREKEGFNVFGTVKGAAESWCSMWFEIL